jgi:FdhE protein
MTPFSWDKRIARAEQLANEYPVTAEILCFYVQVARFQKRVYEGLNPGPGCSLQPASVSTDFLPFLHLVRSIGPPAIAEVAAKLMRDNIPFEDVLEAWNNPGESENDADRVVFFARALLQPFAERLATRNSIPARSGGASCPFCGEEPVVGVLRGEGDGGKRWLMCSLCSSEWEFRRLICPACAEERNDRLPVYTAAEFGHVRLEACDTCRAYIKTVDLTKHGLAVPCVDEIATVSLNFWAEENGYKKLKRNLLGM